MNKELKNELLNNLSLLKDLVKELNSYNSCLEHLEYYSNDEEFFDAFYGNTGDSKMEIVRAICYGDYKYNDELVHFDALGNLESCEMWEYEEMLKDNIDEIIDNLIENKENIYLYDIIL